MSDTKYTGYPVIFNGDHAEFEREHANTPPHERPDWPLPSFDAKDLAAAFCKIANDHGYKNAKGEPIDEGWMQAWFANALMRGFDEHDARTAPLNAEMLEALQMCMPALEWCQKQWANSPQHGDGVNVLDVVRAAIARATGGNNEQANG